MVVAERLGIILQPKQGYAKFNAGMIREGETVHMLYRWAASSRPQGEQFPIYSQDHVAYARMDLKGNVLEDTDETPFIKLPPNPDGSPVYTQDPRIVPFEGEYYLFYTVWNMKAARVGISRTKDFKTVEHIGIVPNGNWDKDAFILPERIKGKIAYVHRVEPEIQIDYFNSFSEMLDEAYWKDYSQIKDQRMVIRGEHVWENQKVGGSVPPIETELGWLFIYHGVSNDRTPFCYRAGVAVLDRNNPSKVVYRLPYPILEPTEEYECRGDVPEVVFPQGVYLNGDHLYMSYGGADTIVAMCRYNYSNLINELSKYPV